MYGPYYHDWMFGGAAAMLFGILWMILIWAVPFLAAVALLKYLFTKSRPDGQARAKPTPLDLLKEAYARGDIDRDAFMQKRDDLLEK